MPILDITLSKPLPIALMYFLTMSLSSAGLPGSSPFIATSVSKARYGLIASAP
jgi:hypothetical protein